MAQVNDLLKERAAFCGGEFFPDDAPPIHVDGDYGGGRRRVRRHSAGIRTDPLASRGAGAECVDHDLDRAIDSIGAGRLLFRIADVLAKNMKNPQSAARAYGVLLARLEGLTLDQIARREGVSRERIRQVALRTRRIVAATPDIFEGFGGLEQAARNEALGGEEGFRSWCWRRGFGEFGASGR